MREKAMPVEQFSEQGASYSDCLQKVRMKYGDSARVMNYRSVRVGGIFGGLFARDGVEVTGYVATDFCYATGKAAMCEVAADG
jgi:flagellar biosynthesis protein FlhF